MSGSPPTACSILYRPDLHLLIVRWPGDAPVPQLQADFEAVLQEAEQHGVARWLLDVRRRDQLNPELGQWTNYTFYPLASTRLAPLPLRIAVLCSPTRLTIYDSDAQQREYLTYGLSAERPYQLRLFGDEGAAMQWLFT
ncbi:hypothetical protein [Hymenobacter cellulosivorans]|uniref:STAS/SEC14 domain-containing protein n=1 Tax=Hymenobacter cellulosivorans TaxID=2932249 RepID=A0ABY4FH14_9BACT|nr:hypothetical protein [Hymenobacter cellulosivorans]UOQ55317.1 hypothetical protein MUN80_11310 [Hymenobacter cellulosivorans]